MIKLRYTLSYRILSAFIAFTFIFTLVLPPGYAQVVSSHGWTLQLPAPGTMVAPTAAFTPTLIKGLTIHPENPLEFDFIVEKGQTPLQGEEFNKESMRLVKYFLASLTVPEDQMWVNLSPHEKNRIISENLGATEMGKDMLAQDYILKQLTASLMYPENELGKKFWDRIYKKAREQYGTTEVPLDTFNKVWIMPDKAVVYEHEGSVFVIESHLKVMLESDYEALQHASKIEDGGWRGEDQSSILDSQSSIIKEVILPEIEKEVNEGRSFANLRQIYNSMILATWYKKNLRESLLGQVYVDKSKTRGVDLKDPTVNQKIYEQYLEAFKRGVYNYIKEDVDPVTKEVIPRKYFSGGAVGLKESNLTTLYSLPPAQQKLVVNAFKDIGNTPGARFNNLKIELYEIAEANNIPEDTMTEIVRGIENTAADEVQNLFVGESSVSSLVMVDGQTPAESFKSAGFKDDLVSMISGTIGLAFEVRRHFRDRHHNIDKDESVIQSVVGALQNNENIRGIEVAGEPAARFSRGTGEYSVVIAQDHSIVESKSGFSVGTMLGVYKEAELIGSVFFLNGPITTMAITDGKRIAHYAYDGEQFVTRSDVAINLGASTGKDSPSALGGIYTEWLQLFQEYYLEHGRGVPGSATALLKTRYSGVLGEDGLVHGATGANLYEVLVNNGFLTEIVSLEQARMLSLFAQGAGGSAFIMTEDGPRSPRDLSGDLPAVQVYLGNKDAVGKLSAYFESRKEEYVPKELRPRFLPAVKKVETAGSFNAVKLEDFLRSEVPDMDERPDLVGAVMAVAQAAQKVGAMYVTGARATGQIDSGGAKQLAIDEQTDQLFMSALRPWMKEYYSEDLGHVVDFNGDGIKLRVMIDALDGSSRVKGNGGSGTIVSFRKFLPDTPLEEQTGKEIVASMIVAHGITPKLVLAIAGMGVYEFILGEGTFYGARAIDLSQPKIQGKGLRIALGGERPAWPKGFPELADQWIQQGAIPGYSGAFVTDVWGAIDHMLDGGRAIFSYPANKLRVKSELQAVAYLFRVAGGANLTYRHTDGKEALGLTDLLDVGLTPEPDPAKQQKAPSAFGDVQTIQEMRSALAVSSPVTIRPQYLLKNLKRLVQIPKKAYSLFPHGPDNAGYPPGAPSRSSNRFMKSVAVTMLLACSGCAIPFSRPINPSHYEEVGEDVLDLSGTLKDAGIEVYGDGILREGEDSKGRYYRLINAGEPKTFAAAKILFTSEVDFSKAEYLSLQGETSEGMRKIGIQLIFNEGETVDGKYDPERYTFYSDIVWAYGMSDHLSLKDFGLDPTTLEGIKGMVIHFGDIIPKEMQFIYIMPIPFVLHYYKKTEKLGNPQGGSIYLRGLDLIPREGTGVPIPLMNITKKETTSSPAINRGQSRGDRGQEIASDEGRATSDESASSLFERVGEIDDLLARIDKEIERPGSGNLPEIMVTSDYHGEIKLFLNYIADAVSRKTERTVTLDSKQFPQKTIERQLKDQDVDIKEAGITFYILGDFLDRGVYGIKTFKAAEELVDLGVARYVTGNHDFWAFLNLMGFHLPVYEGYNFYGHTQSEELVRQHWNDADIAGDRIGRWTQRLAEYNSAQKKLQEEIFGGRLKEIREGFKKTYAGLKDQLTQEEKELWEDLIGFYFGTTDVYTGFNGVGLMSAQWWEEKYSKVKAYAQAARETEGSYEINIAQAMKRQTLEKFEEYAAEAARIVRERLDHALQEGKWWWQVFNDTNHQNYTSVEWWGKDWSSHEGWGTTVIDELNELEGEKIWNQANYIRNPHLQELAAFYRKHFTLYLKDPYGNTYTHGWLPVDKETGKISFTYGGITYEGDWIWDGLKAIQDDVRDSSKPLSALYEALNLVNAWYADKTTQIKPEHIAYNIERLGLKKIYDANGIGKIWFTGHNPQNKLAPLGGGFKVQQGDYVLITTDKGMSWKKFGDLGGYVGINAKGIQQRGYATPGFRGIVDNPPVMSVKKGKGEGAGYEVTKSWANESLSGEDFLNIAKNQLKEERKRLEEASSPVGEEDLEEIKRLFREQILAWHAQDVRELKSLETFSWEGLKTYLTMDSEAAATGKRFSKLEEIFKEKQNRRPTNQELEDLLRALSKEEGEAARLFLISAVMNGFIDDVSVEFIKRLFKGPTSSPIDQLVDQLIESLNLLNGRFAQELDQLASDFSGERLHTLKTLTGDIKSQMRHFRETGRQVDSEIAHPIMDVLVNQMVLFTTLVELGLETNDVPELKERFKDYQKEFQNLELIVGRGELKNIKSYWGPSHFVNLEKLPQSPAQTQDRQANEKVGGIDLNPALLDLQIRRDGNGVPLPLPMQPIQDMHIEGFLPIIINVTPVTNLPMLLGLVDTQPDTDASYETQPGLGPMDNTKPFPKASPREPVGRKLEEISYL